MGRGDVEVRGEGWADHMSLGWHVNNFEPYSVGQLGAKKGSLIQTNADSAWASHCL